MFDTVEEDEVVAACNPLDVSEIIQEAQSKASVNPKIIRSQKRKSDVPKRVTFKPMVDSNPIRIIQVQPEDPVNAAPPYKKRFLVSAKDTYCIHNIISFLYAYYNYTCFICYTKISKG